MSHYLRKVSCKAKRPIRTISNEGKKTINPEFTTYAFCEILFYLPQYFYNYFPDFTYLNYSTITLFRC